jgi:phage terminase large subunit
VLTSRRSGKSWAAISILIYKCLTNPNSECLFIGLNYKAVLKSGWKIAKRLLNKYNVNVNVNKTNLTIEFDNGSLLYFGSCNHKEDADSFLGTAYHLVIIDEAGSFEPETLDYLIDEVIDPALAEVYGSIIMLGTPREYDGGKFYDATSKTNQSFWQTYSWKTSENIHIADAWASKIKQLVDEHPGVDIWSIPKIRREYLGQWAREESAYVYTIDSDSLIEKFIPNNPTYIMGLDIGYRDASAFVISAWNKYSNTYYIVESFKKSGMLYDDIANKIKYYRNKYKINIILVDSAGGSKIIQESLDRYFNESTMPIQAADKTEKHNHIEMFNTYMKLKRVKIVEKDNIELIKEMKELPLRRSKSGKLEEHPGYDNHLCDSLIYSWKYAYAYLELPKIIPDEEEIMYNKAEALMLKKKKLFGRKNVFNRMG